VQAETLTGSQAALASLSISHGLIDSLSITAGNTHTHCTRVDLIQCTVSVSLPPSTPGTAAYDLPRPWSSLTEL